MLNERIKFNSIYYVITLTLIILKTKANHEKKPGLIYLLLWSALNTEPLRYYSKKLRYVKSMNCSYQNCYVVNNRDYFQDVTDYDAILFTVKGLGSGRDLPTARSDNQIYVFVSLESPTNFPFYEQWNWFFNYTWTYKLDSDILHSYFIARNKHGEVVAPKVDARWKTFIRMKPTDVSVIEKLKNKTTAAAWFVTNCEGDSKRLLYAHNLNRALSKYNLNVDIYGVCGNKICPKSRFMACFTVIEERYYFYLAFENSYCEDYVTEKLMTAMKHNAVPVVLGAANYSRFVPDGAYINANVLTEEEVAAKINEAIQDKQRYYDYFRWRQYYTYHSIDEKADTDPLCAFCALLNDESKRNQRRVYARFDKWWNEFRGPNDTDIIVRYEDSDPHIKSIITYRDRHYELKVETSGSPLEQVNSFVDDIINYYFQ